MSKMQGQRGGGRGRGKRDSHDARQDEFEQRILDLARVTRVVAGGKRMRFRAAVLVGDKKGRVGLGMEKGADVSGAVNKAARLARKHLIAVLLRNETISHETRAKFGAALVLLKPAPKGAGIIAGGPMRMLFELAGVPNVVGKILGSKNKINNAMATLQALSQLKAR